MPTQTSIVETKFYTQWDTAPDLEDILYGKDKTTPLDLTDADIYVIVSHALGSTWQYVKTPIVDHEPGFVIGDPTEGKVGWTPTSQSLYIVGFFDYQWVVVYANSRIQTIEPSTYKHIRVQAPPGGRTTAPWSP